MPEETPRVSFFSKNQVECPVCETKFYREDMLTGRGRLIAGALRDDLRREYEPSPKYGEVKPLVYPVTVCPGCYYAAFPRDFGDLKDEARGRIETDSDRRITEIQRIFEELDFRETRTLKEGAAAYYFAMTCYDFHPSDHSPTIKQGICALRGAWLFEDLHRNDPEENYDYLARIFYRKARFFYGTAVEHEQNGVESLVSVPHLGPDVDKNYGYDGVLYLASYLELHFGPRADEEARTKSLQRAKTIAARLFGMGKASKQKPSVILDKARDLYHEIGEILDMQGDVADGQP